VKSSVGDSRDRLCDRVKDTKRHVRMEDRDVLLGSDGGDDRRSPATDYEHGELRKIVFTIA
jgi:hypothetical protein